MIPKKWGQGQLFAFSALDSDSYFTDDFTGILSGEKVGVVFYTQCKRTLFFGNMNKFISPEFECVTSDMILQSTLLGNNSIIFAQRHLVVGEYCDMLGVFANADGECEITKKGDIEIHNTKDGEYTALLRRDEKYAFAYGKSESEVIDLCQKGIALDIDKLKEIKKKPFENKLPDDDKYASLYAKCISVMRSQLYSPEGNIKRIWSTPDRLPHRNMWLWDSVFHAIGHRNIDPALAENLILAMLDVQREDGFIPHMARPDYISEITQPPVIAWGAWFVYEKSGNKEFLKTVLEKNKAFLLWCSHNRRKSEKELYSWHTNPELNNRCDESGMDNSPRFDTENDLFAIDFSCYMANETRFMKIIADELVVLQNTLSLYEQQIQIQQEQRKKAGEAVANSIILQKIHDIANSDKNAKEEIWDELNNFILTQYPQFKINIYSLHHISELEYQVCMLIKCQVPPTEISRLINRSKESVSSIRRRLYYKLLNKKGSPQDFDQFILSL